MSLSCSECDMPRRDSSTRSSEDLADADSLIEPGNGNTPLVLETTSSLEGLQSVEQRNVLNIIDQLRKCGLESTLSLPQLVVCGDQSAGKSSIMCKSMQTVGTSQARFSEVSYNKTGLTTEL